MPRARELLAFSLGAAGEDPRAGWLIAGLGVKRTQDCDRLHMRRALGIVRVKIALEALEPDGRHTGRDFVEERRREITLAGFDKAADAEAFGFESVRSCRRVRLQGKQIFLCLAVPVFERMTQVASTVVVGNIKGVAVSTPRRAALELDR